MNYDKHRKQTSFRAVQISNNILTTPILYNYPRKLD